MKKILGIFLLVLTCATLSFGDDSTSSSATSETTASSSANVPLFVGGYLGIGSGTGVGSEKGIGLNDIEGIAGYWYPKLGFIRVGYGFSTFKEEDESNEKYSVDHSNFSIEMGIHAYGDLYVMGTYARAKDLSDLGDVAWNEYGVGMGSIVSVLSKTMLIAELQYRWVRNHYDPFLDENVKGTRLQFNLGFVVYVY